VQQKPTIQEHTFDKTEIESKIGTLLDRLQQQVINRQISWESIPDNYLDEGVNFLKFYQSEIIDWKDHSIVPDNRMLGNPGKWTYLKNSGLDYLSTIYQDTDGYVIAVIVWLKKDYKISNRYLQPTLNKAFFDNRNVTLSEPSYTSLPIIYKDIPLFGLVYITTNSDVIQSIFVIVLIILAISLFIVAIFGIYQSLIKLNRLNSALISVIALISILRLSLLLLRFPSDFFAYPITDASFFASSWFNPSMLDYIINYFLLLLVVYLLFIHYIRLTWLKNTTRKKISYRILVATIFYLLILFSGLLIWVNYQTIYHNSSISLDITDSIKIESLRLLAYVSIIITSIIFLLVAHICLQSIRLFLTFKYQLISLLFSGIVFISINVYNNQYFIIPFIIVLLYLLLIQFSKLYRSTVNISFNSFLYFFTMVFCTSVMGTAAIIYFEREDQSSMQRKFANEFLLEGDDLAEFLLSEAKQGIVNDLFIQSRLASPFLSKETIRQKIRQIYLSRYFDKYNVEVLLYNANGLPFDQREMPTLPLLIASLEANAQRTDYENLYFISDTGRDIFKRYFTLIPVERNNALLGFIVIDLTLKRVIPDNVYPELLVDTRFLQPYRDFNFSYAIYENHQLQYYSGDFDYNNEVVKQLININAAPTKGLVINNYLHNVIQDEGNRIAVVSTQWDSAEKVLAGFSFLFLTHLSVMLLIIIILGLYALSTGNRLNYSTRIQLYLNLAFFLPLIIMSITVLGIMSSSFRQEQSQEYLEKARILSLRVQQLIEEYSNSDQDDLAQRVTSLAALANVEMNIYDVNGLLLLSSQPQIFDKNIQSIYLNPLAKLEIIDKARQSTVLEERISELRYYNAYAALRSSGSGKLVGVLSIPYYDSGFHIERARIKVLTNIINVFTLLFFVFLLISFFASKWLTFPLRFITQKLKRTTLTGQNLPLVWEAQDEIGIMVTEYNRMLDNLEKSKTQLERSQLEAAWREIAQQVAHEIKNPLTPMKLTLQHLQNMLQNAEIDKTKTEKSLQALLKEVDTLNGIASSFSAFAKMPKPAQNKVDLVQSIKNAVELYSNQGYVDIQLDLQVEHAFILADEQLLSRILSNLFLNALQSSNDNKSVQVTVTLLQKDNTFEIHIRDNGRGISEEMKEKIFLPRFTTKHSGSGIGLAIVKQGIEYFNGKIWFESKQSKGSVFYISFPAI
jgi:two-component system, NtrC family, nitrogen regulation sensor histidine kinase NtrY